MIKPVTITLNVTDRIDKAFKKIPSNANIHKGRCAIGGTHLEIITPRHSLMFAPTKGVIDCKCKKHPEIFAVKGGVLVPQIAEYLNSNVEFKKIMFTPDSFQNIIDAAISIGKLDELYREYFLLMDESHSAITENWRKKMLVPFKYFGNFTNKTLISATPFDFSDPEIKKLTQYRIKFHEPYIGKIIIVNTLNLNDCVDFYINHRHLFPGKPFFFYNSVTEIADVIRRNNLRDPHIYCADKTENFEKLPENLLAFQQEPETGKYADINFFTCKYFEGFDLEEENATIFLVTDVHKAHTKVGITNKGVQAVGRVRFPPAQVYHITNNRNKPGMKTLAQFRKEYEIHTTKLIHDYNSYIIRCEEEGIEPIENPESLIEKFVDIDEETAEATLNETKLDGVLNELACNEEFNNLEGIVNAWERSLFEVEQRPFFSKAKAKKRKSKVDKFKDFIDLIDSLEKNKGSYKMGFAAKELAKLQAENPIGFEAYYLLGKDKLNELGNKENMVELALIELHNTNAEPKLLAYLDTKLKVGDRRVIEDLANLLQHGYNLFQIKNPNTGKVRRAYANQLGWPGRYKIDECKENVNGKQVNGFIIVKKYFSVSVAA